MELLVLATVVFIVIFKATITSLNYWKRKRVAFVKPIPLFGNFKDSILSRLSEAEVVQELYRQLEGEQFGGVYQSHTPVLMLRDPELIKQILGKDFSVFSARIAHFDEKNDPLSANIFNFEGKIWRDTRSRLTPTFTPGKVKEKFNHFQGYARDLSNYLGEFAKEGKTIEIKDILLRFSVDVICSSLFGLEANAMKNLQSEVYEMVQKLDNVNGHPFQRLLKMVAPRVYSVVGSTSRRSTTEFFSSLAEDILAFREQTGTEGNDWISLLARLGSDANSQGAGVRLVAAHLSSLLRAGSAKTASVLACALYELAANPGLQARLRTEVDSATRRSGGLTHHAVQSLPFLDSVVAETLRKYPVEETLTRVSRGPYTLPGTALQLEEGTRVLIPVYALQRDPRHYPDPDTFQPDRFSEHSRGRGVYLPFGEGPRMCIGYRFGLLQVKVGLATLIGNYHFTAGNKTRTPALHTRLGITHRAKSSLSWSSSLSLAGAPGCSRD